METKWRLLARLASPSLAETGTAAPSAPMVRPAAPLPPWPMISVIIPAHNEEGYLGQTLEAIENQDYPRFEVIVVPNGCSDQTAVIAETRCDRLLVLPEGGISRARNLGAGLAQGELLLFLDADTLLEPNALKTIAEEFTRDYSAGTIKGKPDSPRLTFRILYALKNLMHRSTLHKGSVGVILCWKDFFQAVGGFDEALHAMENSQLILQLQKFGKYRCIGSTSAITSMRRYEKNGFWQTTRLWFELWYRSWRGELRHKRYAPIR